MQLSIQQEAVCEFVKNDQRSLLVKARAGTGKSQTGVESLKRLDPRTKTLMLAFNKAIVAEMSMRVPPFVISQGFNSAGHRICSRFIPGIAFRENKTQDIIHTAYGRNLSWPIVNAVKKVVSLAKANALVPESFARVTPGCKLATMPEMVKLVNSLWLDSRFNTEQIAGMASHILDLSAHATHVIDYDDQVYFPVVRRWPFEKYQFVYVDEDQDLSPIQQVFAKRCLEREGRLLGTGDDMQCQPIGTLVSMTGGFLKRIEDVQVGDSVVTYQSKHSYFAGIVSQGRKVLQTASRHFSGQLLKFTVGRKVSYSTPNHKWLVRFNPNARGKFVVYLMQKGMRFRIGTSTLLKNTRGSGKGGLGIESRVNVEDADCAWILSVHDTFVEARVQEQLVICNFGIPGVLFPTEKRQRTQEVNTDFLESVWSAIGVNFDKAVVCLQHFGREYAYPFHTRNGEKFGRYSSVIHACNILSELMSMRTYDDKSVGGRWLPILVDYEDYEGMVYSLEVENSESESPGRHLYISDGIVTHNSIYQWRGADSASIETMKKMFNCEELPLTVSFRCPKSVIKEAQQYCPDIESHPDSPEGSVTSVATLDPFSLKDDDFILCRYNAPLFSLGFKLIKVRVPFQLRNRGDIEEVIKFIRNFRVSTLTDLLAKVRDWELLEVQRAEASDEQERIPLIYDKADCVRFLTEDVTYNDVDSLLNDIESAFSHRRGPTLSSIHRAKGLERNRVYIILPRVVDRGKGKVERPGSQEKNLSYVAVTRARQELIYLPETYRLK